MRQGAGFTFFEFMIAIAIAGILLGLGVPGTADLFAKRSADANAHAVWRALAKTREVAVMSGKRATFCGMDNNGDCVRDDIRTLAIFIDRNRNRRLDGKETLVQRVDLNFNGEVVLRAAASQKFLVYNSNGYARLPGSILLCHKSKNAVYARRVSVNRGGRPYLVRDRNGDGVVEGVDGTPIDCG